MTNWIYDVFLWIFSILVDLFFREVHPRGSWKVPRRGPVIFVAAPHANQVYDETLQRFTLYLLTTYYLVRGPSHSYAHPSN